MKFKTLILILSVMFTISLIMFVNLCSFHTTETEAFGNVDNEVIDLGSKKTYNVFHISSDENHNCLVKNDYEFKSLYFDFLNSGYRFMKIPEFSGDQTLYSFDITTYPYDKDAMLLNVLLYAFGSKPVLKSNRMYKIEVFRPTNDQIGNVRTRSRKSIVIDVEKGGVVKQADQLKTYQYIRFPDKYAYRIFKFALNEEDKKVSVEDFFGKTMSLEEGRHSIEVFKM